MSLQNKDFIEIEFTGKTKEGEIFDSNIKEDLEKIDSKSKPEPFIYCLGEGMFLKAIDEFLIGKDIGKYEIELTSDKAFGNRDPSLIQMVPMKIFREQRLNPVPGAMFNFDGKIAKIITVSGGRIMVDFNNPLSGKTVEYKVIVKRKINDLNEKAESLIEFFTKRKFKFEIKDKKLIVFADKQFAQFLNLFKDKFKEILDLDLEAKEEKNSPK